jgi:nucleoside diphosphate kinase
MHFSENFCERKIKLAFYPAQFFPLISPLLLQKLDELESQLARFCAIATVSRTNIRSVSDRSTFDFLGRMEIQLTVAIIKPHAIVNRLKILQLLKDSGFRLVGQRCVEINIDEAWYLCKAESGKVAADTSQTEQKIHSLLGTALILLLNHEKASGLMSEVLGPEDPVEARKSHPNSIRARFGQEVPYDVIAVAGG